ncbi:MAG: hypothetical protein KDC26_03765 [Armatimonadetes bacterium]|nr:hypothetical protein [Armatimonadota bacterium]
MSENPIVTKFKESGWEIAMSDLETLNLAEQMKALNALIIHHRWELKDLQAIVKLSSIAEEKINGSDDEEAMSGFKAICFNRAAFFWRGWGDDDVEITPEAEKEAAPYAMKNLELAIQLKKPDIAVSRAEWAVGAFAWAAGDNSEAAKRFDRAAELAVGEEDDKEMKMDRAYAMAARGEDPNALLAELDAAEEGGFFADQVRSAMKVYG